MSMSPKFSFPLLRRIWQLFWNEQDIWMSASCFYNKYQLGYKPHTGYLTGAIDDDVHDDDGGEE